MPPEQARGEWSDVDARSDVWAFGATLYALLTGTPVRQASTPNLALLAAMTEPVRPLREVAPYVPADVGRIVDQALALERDARFPDARAMQIAVRRARERLATGAGTLLHVPDAVSPPANAPMRSGFAPRPSSARAKLAAAAAFIAGVVIVGGVLVRSSRTESTRASSGVVAEPKSIIEPTPPLSATASASAMPPAPSAIAEPAPKATARPRRAAPPPSPPVAAAPAPRPPPVSAPPPPADPVSPLDIRR
jgi:serine/threonine protein kinase